MQGDLTPSQLALAEYMSELSEQAFAAGWMDGLEFALWEVRLGQRDRYGQMALGPEHVTRLTALSAECGGWIVFDDLREESWLSIGDWTRRYATHCGVALEPGAELEPTVCRCGTRFYVPYLELNLRQVMASQKPIADSIQEFRKQSPDARGSWMSALIGVAYAEGATEERMLQDIIRHHRRKVANEATYRCPQCGRTGEAPLHPRY
jgi:hypothetical protein